MTKSISGKSGPTGRDGRAARCASSGVGHGLAGKGGAAETGDVSSSAVAPKGAARHLLVPVEQVARGATFDKGARRRSHDNTAALSSEQRLTDEKEILCLQRQIGTISTAALPRSKNSLKNGRAMFLPMRWEFFTCFSVSCAEAANGGRQTRPAHSLLEAVWSASSANSEPKRLLSASKSVIGPASDRKRLPDPPRPLRAAEQHKPRLKAHGSAYAQVRDHAEACDVLDAPASISASAACNLSRVRIVRPKWSGRFQRETVDGATPAFRQTSHIGTPASRTLASNLEMICCWSIPAPYVQDC